MPVIKKIDTYFVMYSANSFIPRVELKSGGIYVGQLLFKPNGAALSADSMVGSVIRLYYHFDDYDNVMDLLRNEAPIYLWYNGSGPGFENGIRTTDEVVGEGEAT